MCGDQFLYEMMHDAGVEVDNECYIRREKY